MDATRTPGWMIGLLVIFSLAAATTFGLFLFRHAQKAAAVEVHSELTQEIKWLREQHGRIEAEVAPLDNQIAIRRVLAKTLKDADAQAIDDVSRLVTQNQINVRALEEAVRKQTQTYQDLLKDAKERRMELAQEETRAFANEKDFDDRRATLRAKIETISQEIEKVKKEGRTKKGQAPPVLCCGERLGAAAAYFFLAWLVAHLPAKAWMSDRRLSRSAPEAVTP